MAVGTRVGSIYYDVGLDTTAFNRSAQTLGTRLQDVGRRMSDVGRNMTK